MVFEEFKNFIDKVKPEIEAIAARHVNQVTVEYKSDKSPVTQADREIEKYLEACITEYFPTHAIVGEEFGIRGEVGELEWILDPIDGTKSFIHGVPLYTTLIGVMEQGRPLFGAILNPSTSEAVVGDSNITLWNGRPVRMRDCADLSEATLLTTDVMGVERYRSLDSFLDLARQCRTVRTWGDGWGYLLLATGRADIMVDSNMSRWDIAALIPVIRGAGGVITGYNGELPETADGIIAANSTLYPQVMERLHKTQTSI